MIGQRFAGIGVANSAEKRRVFRHLMFSTKNLCETLGGVILEKETIIQKFDDGTRVTDTQTIYFSFGVTTYWNAP